MEELAFGEEYGNGFNSPAEEWLHEGVENLLLQGFCLWRLNLKWQVILVKMKLLVQI